MINDYSGEIIKKEFEKSIVSELCKKGIIDFEQCNNIIRKLDEDIIKLVDRLNAKKNMTSITVKIPI